MLIAALFLAVAGAFCFATGASLQQREAVRAAASRGAKVHSVWQLARRPIWLVGVGAAGLGAAGVLFALPLAAVFQGHGARPWELLAALLVLTGLSVLLVAMPKGPGVPHVTPAAAVAFLVLTGALTAALAAASGTVSRRWRSALLAAGAGVAFGATSVFVRALMRVADQSGQTVPLLLASAGIAVLAPLGFLLTQGAYRAGGLPAAVAAITVLDPLTAAAGGIRLLGEPFPSTSAAAVTVTAGAAAAALGIAVLARSPAHAVTTASAEPRDVASSDIDAPGRGVGRKRYRLGGGRRTNGGEPVRTSRDQPPRRSPPTRDTRQRAQRSDHDARSGWGKWISASARASSAPQLTRYPHSGRDLITAALHSPMADTPTVLTSKGDDVLPPVLRTGVPPAPRVVILSASVGAGHDGAADELAERMRHRGFAVHQHDFIELLPASLGYHVRRVYASQLRLAPGSWSWLMRVTGRRTLAGAVGALTTLAAGSSLLRAIASSPAVVVSTHHLVSQVLGRLRSGGRLAAPAVTFLTDMSVHRLWVSEGVDVHLAIGPSAMAQARALKAGMVYACAPAVSAMFRPVRCAAERRRAREYFGLPANSPIALIVAGSWGAGDVVRTARDIAESGLAVPVVACGRNERLRRRIARAGTGQALGWVDEMADLLRACEVVVQNAGGLTSLQSLATGVPMLTYRPIPGHGLANAAALDRAGLAPWVHDRVQLQAALRRALDGSKREPRLVRAWPATDPAALVEAVAMRWATTTGEMSRIHDRRPISTRGNPTAQPLPEEVPM